MTVSGPTLPTTYRFVPLRWRDSLEAGRWRYPGEYHVYDGEPLELIGAVVLQTFTWLAGGAGFYSVLDEQEQLIGIFTYTRTRDGVEIGLGLRPDLTGKGLGVAFVEAGLAFARRRYHPRRFALEVAQFNVRAQKVYERAGFQANFPYMRRTRYGQMPYLQMTRPA